MNHLMTSFRQSRSHFPQIPQLPHFQTQAHTLLYLEEGISAP